MLKAISRFGFLTYPIPPVLQPAFSKCLWATPARVPFPPLTEVSSLAPFDYPKLLARSVDIGYSSFNCQCAFILFFYTVLYRFSSRLLYYTILYRMSTDFSKLFYLVSSHADFCVLYFFYTKMIRKFFYRLEEPQ